MDGYPRSRKETSAPLSIEEISEVLQEQWGYRALDIDGIGSRKIHFVNLPHRRVVFRANPGWDGAMPPPVIVKYVDHLSKLCAPVPEIIPTQTGKLHTQLRDWTLSVESRLPGEDMSQSPIKFLHSVGKRLAQLHSAAKTFPDYRGEMRPAKEYVQAMFERSLSRPLEKDEQQAIEKLQRNIEGNFQKTLDLEVLWILCRGDVRPHNTLATEGGEVWFTDFDCAEYAPALFDVVMTRFQWFLRLMDLSDAADILRGYHSERSLCEAEISVFPVIWSAYYTDRITFLLDRRRTQRSRANREEEIQKYRVMILKLPTEALSMGQDLLKDSNLL
jgi:Ser/Thr protein kinase RdoA (MazF antagonist)